MEMNRNRLLLLALVGVFSTAGSFYISKGDRNISDDSINRLMANIEDNKNNITTIKQSLDKIAVALSEKPTPLGNPSVSSEQSNTTNNDVQALKQHYEALSNELQTLKQKNEQLATQDKASKAETEKPVESLEDIQAARQEEERQFEEEMRKYEEDWQQDSVDAVATTEIQGEVENIFSSEIKGLNNVNSECKSTGCKITLEVTSDFSDSPVPMLLDKGGHFFADKDFVVKSNVDPSTGQEIVAIYVTKATDDEK